MSVPYKVTQRRNPLKQDEEGLYYPASAYYGEVDIDSIAEDISLTSTIAESDVIAVMRSFLKTLPKFLKLGYKIRLNDFGIIKIGISGSGEESADDVSTKNITSTKVLFLADSKLKKELSNLSFTKTSSAESSDSDSESESETEEENEESSDESSEE